MTVNGHLSPSLSVRWPAENQVQPDPEAAHAGERRTGRAGGATSAASGRSKHGRPLPGGQGAHLADLRPDDREGILVGGRIGPLDRVVDWRR